MAEAHTGFIIVRLAAKRLGPLLTESDDLRVLARKANALELSRVLDEYADCATERVVTSVEPRRILELENTAAKRGFPVTRSLTSYWRLDARRIQELKKLLERLTQVDVVERAYQELTPTEPAVNPADDVFSVLQGYVNAAPKGIDARWAWTQPYGSGASVGFVDLEQGWTLAHEDFPPIVALPGVSQDVNPPRASHGTAVLGIVAGVDNTKGIIGIAPTPAWVSVASHFRASDGTEGHVADAISSVLSSGGMAEGDVLLLEVTTNNLPIEVDDNVFAAIELATGLGMIVIEAAGNGNVDLDTVPELNRLNPSTFSDSRAVIVGACMSALDPTGTGHERWKHPVAPAGSNFGSRVDCYAYGENVVTTGPGFTPAATLSGTVAGDQYRNDFGGTSAAAAIVAGAAVVLQGMNKGMKGVPLDPLQMRDALSQQGTPQAPGQLELIGVMPDLKKAAHTLNIAVDVGTSVPAPPTNLRVAR